MADPKQSSVAEWFAGKSREELEVLEFDGRQLYAETIKRRDVKTGAIIEVPVYVRAPNSTAQSRAHLDALKWVATLSDSKEQLTAERAASLVGASNFEEMVMVCVVARCTFKRDMPKAQYLLYEFLDETHSKAAIFELYARLDFYLSQESPRISKLDPEQAWAAISAIARVQHAGPLVAIDGSEHASFIVFMASQLQSYRTTNASPLSVETSSASP